ncbi:MAG: hypothetical protein AAFN30_07245, partial [Actinomycetota bacterium]
TPGGAQYAPPAGQPSSYPPPSAPGQPSSHPAPNAPSQPSSYPAPNAPGQPGPGGPAPAPFHGGDPATGGLPGAVAPQPAFAVPSAPGIEATAHAGFHPTTDPTAGSTADGAGRSRLPLVAIALVALLAVGGLAAIAGTRVLGGGGDITGPTAGLVGQEAVFAIDDGAVGTWTVNGNQFQGSSVAVVPTTAGWVQIAVYVDGSSSELVYTATEAEARDNGIGALAIEGPGTANVGEAIQLTMAGADTGTWTVDGTSYAGAAIEVRPTTAGTITVRLEADGQSVERVITAIERR